jgi:hypothetical protein
VDSAAELGWSRLSNGELLDRAEATGYEAVVTTDQQLCHQQKLEGRRIRVLVLLTTSWPRMRPRADDVRTRLEQMGEGQYAEMSF